MQYFELVDSLVNPRLILQKSLVPVSLHTSYPGKQGKHILLSWDIEGKYPFGQVVIHYPKFIFII